MRICTGSPNKLIRVVIYKLDIVKRSKHHIPDPCQTLIWENERTNVWHKRMVNVSYAMSREN